MARVNLRIRTHGVPLTAALRQRVEEKVERAFEGTAARVALVSVRLVDAAGATEGCEKRCSVAVTIRLAGKVRVSESAPDPLAAMEAALDRAAAGVSLALERERALLLEWAARP
jgi:ribosome-associated translation inhibitor RaiA